ncbi:germin-like protein [Musa troglodytarum]|uniref:Germin-like protein n=1 Tax=Musa troglodytarum TaxID=320322 RepID=A0A9E7G454_9LILI|nr:germin-like protein [Musa troglodytarum]
MAAKIVLISLLAMASSLAMASDPSPLQDFCVADKASKVLVNGFVCKDPMQVTAEDFFAMGLDKAGNTENKVGSMVTAVNVNKLAGLNTLGISMVRIDYAPRGLNPPHTHPRATEILTVIEGQLLVGFVTSNTDNGNRLFTKMLKKGDVFVFPEGLIHFQFNPGHTKTVAIGALSSQNPGTITIANAVFGSKPPISDDVLAKAFQVDKKTVDWLQAHFTPCKRMATNTVYISTLSPNDQERFRGSILYIYPSPPSICITAPSNFIHPQALQMAAKILLIALLALASSHALASDPSPLQDFCVADMDSKVRVNGFVCKDPTVVKAEDFFSTGLDKAGDTGKKLGSNVTAVNVNKIVGLNTLGISMVRIDYAPKGLNAPHPPPACFSIYTHLRRAIGITTPIVASSIPKITRMAAKTLLLALLAVASSLAMASDPSPLQDFCVADKASKVLVNGFVCKDPKVVKAEDFFFRGLDKAGDTGKKLGSNVTAVNVNKLAGLNTLGISMVRIDYAPRGLNLPTLTPRHRDPHRQLFVGFVTSNSDNGNRLFTKMLKKGDVFVFPQGLIHFQFNPGYTNTVAIGALSSQNPGTITVADAVFGSKPPISDEVLAKAFQVDKKTIDWLQAQF